MRDTENRNTVKCKTDKITDKIRKMTKSKEEENKREKLKKVRNEE